MAYHFPETATEADLSRMAAIYKDAERRHGEAQGTYWPMLVTIVCGGYLVAHLAGEGINTLLFGIGVIGLPIGAVAWWQQRRKLGEESRLLYFAGKWFEDHGYRIRPGGSYDRKPDVAVEQRLTSPDRS